MFGQRTLDLLDAAKLQLEAAALADMFLFCGEVRAALISPAARTTSCMIFESRGNKPIIELIVSPEELIRIRLWVCMGLRGFASLPGAVGIGDQFWDLSC